MDNSDNGPASALAMPTPCTRCVVISCIKYFHELQLEQMVLAGGGGYNSRLSPPPPLKLTMAVLWAVEKNDSLSQSMKL